MSYSRRWVFVLGMHRSGTSAVAGAIATSGICFGQTFIDLQGDVNEKGFWEHAELVAINEALLAELSAHWFDPFSIYARYAAGWQPSSALFQRMCDFLSHPEFGDAALCGLKDPRLSVLLPWWQQALRRVGHDVCYLLMNRQVGQVAHSLQRRDKMGILLGSLLWNEYTFCAEYYTRKSSRCWLDYEALIAEPAVAMAQVVDRLGLSVSVTTDFIDPAMQRQQGKPILSLCLPELLVELSQFIETHGMAVLEQDWQSLWQRSRQMNKTSQLWLSALVEDFFELKS
ncbi:sulfotransferase family protein [Aeromonas veronii]|uniref:sulfotransferase family protein n=1 Tax=Aeromonas veronii TaxID=654 RepID=UPI002443B95C|nr:hypothetical protein [Aeromonas veronii]